jgi:hypothetical protein
MKTALETGRPAHDTAAARDLRAADLEARPAS